MQEEEGSHAGWGAAQARKTQQLDFLSIGALTSRHWLKTGYGRKVEKAAEYRNAGHSRDHRRRETGAVLEGGARLVVP